MYFKPVWISSEDQVALLSAKAPLRGFCRHEDAASDHEQPVLLAGTPPSHEAHLSQHQQSSFGGSTGIESNGLWPNRPSADERRLFAPSAADDRLGGLA